ncbi:hypothetical protein [Granulicoccus sp. GXG6511]|uniref:hypothetical protein n=1 Tax=Granulicoccus sp. GXG6511 TaxID=3381351 RepID=UPI003D7DC632
MPTQVFREDSPLYQVLPDDTPVAPDSDELLTEFRRQMVQYYGSPEAPSMDVNYHNYAPALYVARNSDPVHDIIMWNCQNKPDNWDDEVSQQLSGIHIPADMIPDQSLDGSVSIYNEDQDTVTDMWRVRKNDQDQWEACWGGTITNAKESMGAFDPSFGASASGLAQVGYTIRQQELLNGQINHVLGIGIPEIKLAPAVSWPASRTDGKHAGVALTMGQRMRLPADLDIASLNLSPAARAIAQAAQDYGIMVTETSGSVGLGAENFVGLKEDRYEEIFRGRWATQEMLGDPAQGEGAFPFDKLEVLPVDYRPPLNNPGPKGPPPTDLPRPTDPTPTPGQPQPEPTEAPDEGSESTGLIVAAAVGGLGLLALIGVAVRFFVIRSRQSGA